MVAEKYSDSCGCKISRKFHARTHQGCSGKFYSPTNQFHGLRLETQPTQNRPIACILQRNQLTEAVSATQQTLRCCVCNGERSALNSPDTHLIPPTPPAAGMFCMLIPYIHPCLPTPSPVQACYCMLLPNIHPCTPPHPPCRHVIVCYCHTYLHAISSHLCCTENILPPVPALLPHVA